MARKTQASEFVDDLPGEPQLPAADVPSRGLDRALKIIGLLALLPSGLSLVTGAFLGRWAGGMAAIPVSDVQEAGGYVLFFVLPISVLASIFLATIAGLRGGQGRRLGMFAGLLVAMSAPVFAVVVSIMPIRS